MNNSSSLEKTSADLPEEALGIAEIANAIVQLGNGLASIAHGISKTGQIIRPMQGLLGEFFGAVQEVQKDRMKLGGFLGLIRLIRDKDFQRTIQLLKVVPLLLDRITSAQAAGKPS